MIVVADTPVILNLCRVQQELLLRELFKRVLIPRLVAAEFVRLSQGPSRFAGLVLPGWVEIQPDPSPLPPQVAQANLDAGESTAIALCLDQHAEALLIDESLGREVAARLGLRTIGILGILVDARRRGLIQAVKPVLERLEQEAGFWMTASLRQRILQLAEE